MDSMTTICLKLADRSMYTLYHRGETGNKQLVLAAARPEQDCMELVILKNEDSTAVLMDVTLNKSEMPQGQWSELILKLNLTPQGEMDLAVLIGDTLLLDKRCTVELDQLPGQDFFQEAAFQSPSYDQESELLDREEESLQSDDSVDLSGGMSFFSIILAIMLFGLSLFSAYLLGNRLSSPKPPPLSNQVYMDLEEYQAR